MSIADNLAMRSSVTRDQTYLQLSLLNIHRHAMSKEINFVLHPYLEVGATVYQRNGGYHVVDITVLLNLYDDEVEIVHDLSRSQIRQLEDECIKRYLEIVDNG
jgi:hypothetical protein